MLADVLLATPLGAALLVAAGLKVADRTSTAVAAATYGVRGRAARGIWLPLATLEALLAAGLLAGLGFAAWAAAATLAAFATGQAIALAAGRGGAPCGCFGAGGRLSWAGAGRAAVLAAAALAVALTPAAPPPPALRIAAALAALATAALVVLGARRAGTPDGALELTGEGPDLGARLQLEPGLAFFTAEGCRLCRALRPHAERRGATVYDEVADPAAWNCAAIPGAPFALALAPDGTVLAKGTVNTRRQLDSVLAAAGERGEPPADTRRSFLATASAAVAAVTAGRMVGRLVAPGEAEAHHFCGHIFTTDGCPHPTGLPRIDSRGLPLRARDGKPVDDLGRLVGPSGEPVDEAGAQLLDPDGRPLPPATRTAVCKAAGRTFDIAVRTDGAWYRCCNGHVRKLVDCCSTSSRRINGDGGLKGYCYGKRKVFCVMYHQTKVPC